MPGSKVLYGLMIGMLSACGSDKDSDPGDSGAVDDTADSRDDTQDEAWDLEDLGGACPSERRLGGFELVQWDSPGDAFSTVTGNVRDGVVPASVMLAVGSEGDCTLYQKQNPFCDPACESGQVCSLDEICVDAPLKVDLGEISIQGMNRELSLAPDATMEYWTTEVPWPLFDPGARIQLQSSGVALLSLRGIGVETLQAETTWALLRGEDLSLSWTPSTSPSVVFLSLNVDQHGNSPVSLVCETADTGSLVISASFLDNFLSYGISGFTTSTLNRRTADSVELAEGCVDLRVYSQLTGNLILMGAR